MFKFYLILLLFLDQYTIFETNMRKSHNEYRELHDTDPLVLDEKASSSYYFYYLSYIVRGNHFFQCNDC